METINMYLENMFAGLPKTDEIMRAKEELKSMMEDKYRELKAEGKAEHEAVGIVISEFGNLEELLEEIGVTVDGVPQTAEFQAEEGISVSLEQAEAFFEVNKKASRKIGLGVGLCILSPVILILLDTLANFGLFQRKAAEAIGLLALFIMIGCAVILFIMNGIPLSKFDYLKKEKIAVQPGVEQIFRKRRDERTQSFSIKIATGVGLCIMSVIPLIVLDTLYPVSPVGESAVIFLFFFVAVAVYLFITAGMEKESYSVILQEEDYKPDSKEANKTLELISGIYWPVITIIYLGYSFLSFNWHISWIIWPIAGIIFGMIAVICNFIERSTKK